MGRKYRTILLAVYITLSAGMIHRRHVRRCEMFRYCDEPKMRDAEWIWNRLMNIFSLLTRRRLINHLYQYQTSELIRTDVHFMDY